MSDSKNSILNVPTNSGQTLPFIVRAPASGQSLADFVRTERAWIETQLLQHGALLLRGFTCGLKEQRAAEFEQTLQALWGELLTYQDRATPRHQVSGKVYTSTEYPPSHSIFLHNESSFADSWPTRICFFCATPAQQGGATPIADVRQVWQRIDPVVRQRFEAKQVMYVRNFGQGFGLPWETVFNTADRDELEAYCQKADIAVEWLDHGQRLRTRQVRPAVLKHPQTDEWVWFNHAAVLNVSTLRRSLRDAFLTEFALEDLPNNTYYGDGTEIEPDVLDHIRAAYKAEKTLFTWQSGDLLVLDNLLMAHGREPYTGPRQIWVGMAKSMRWAEISSANQLIPPADFSLQSKHAERACLTATPENQRFTQPTPLEMVLAAIWATTLNVEDVDIHDNFFELGGQSLDAIDIIENVQALFQVPLSLRALTLTPTVSALAQSLIKTPAEKHRIEEISQSTLEMLGGDLNDA